MKKIQKLIIQVFSFLALIFNGSCLEAQNHTDNTKKLIVYLSRTHNTEAVAQMIQQRVGGDLETLQLQEPYPENYQQIVDQVQKENETGFLPPLKPLKVELSAYDTIFVGFPTWGMQLPPPVKSFLKNSDLRGKTIIPFNTNAGFGVGSGFDTVKQMSEGATVLKGFSVEGGYEKKGVFLAIKEERAQEVAILLERWLKSLKIK
ncbi:flavodoxin family protein [Leeuwenhoekiella palythoae]|uniref:flavodoxin family protein n=1 Tax=Leeuwenhoekiella palythoae TaxID=573501 RepID=UPI003516D162